MQRVVDLTERKKIKIFNTEDWFLGENRVKGVKIKDDSRPPYVMLVPLQEIIAEAFDMGVNTQTVQREYERLISAVGSEFQVLLSAKKEDLTGITDSKIVEGIEKVRKRDLHIDPGYDGVFGTVRIWGKEKDKINTQEQISLF